MSSLSIKLHDELTASPLTLSVRDADLLKFGGEEVGACLLALDASRLAAGQVLSLEAPLSTQGVVSIDVTWETLSAHSDADDDVGDDEAHHDPLPLDEPEFAMSAHVGSLPADGR